MFWFSPWHLRCIMMKTNFDLWVIEFKGLMLYERFHLSWYCILDWIVVYLFHLFVLIWVVSGYCELSIVLWFECGNCLGKTRGWDQYFEWIVHGWWGLSEELVCCDVCELSLVWLIPMMVECIPQHSGTNVPKEGKIVSCGFLPRGRGCANVVGLITCSKCWWLRESCRKERLWF